MSIKDKLCGVTEFDTGENYMALGMCMGLAAGMMVQQIVFKDNAYLGSLYGIVFGELIGSQISVKINTDDDEILKYMRPEEENILEYLKSTEYIDCDNDVIREKAKELWDNVLASYSLSDKCSLDMFLYLIVNLGIEQSNDYNVLKILKVQWKEENTDKKFSSSEWSIALKEYKKFYIHLAKATFEYVRDEITHSVDVKNDIITYKASDVLINKTGICHAKSNLLAALLRANGIPCGICFQYKKYGNDELVKHCLHAYNAIYIDGNWLKVDARGNKEYVDAQFPQDGNTRLAFGVRNEYNEYYIPWIYKDADEEIMEMLSEAQNIEDVKEGLKIK